MFRFCRSYQNGLFLGTRPLRLLLSLRGPRLLLPAHSLQWQGCRNGIVQRTIDWLGWNHLAQAGHCTPLHCSALQPLWWQRTNVVLNVAMSDRTRKYKDRGSSVSRSPLGERGGAVLKLKKQKLGRKRKGKKERLTRREYEIIFGIHSFIFSFIHFLLMQGWPRLGRKCREQKRKKEEKLCCLANRCTCKWRFRRNVDG